jgi:hypothetical protein
MAEWCMLPEANGGGRTVPALLCTPRARVCLGVWRMADSGLVRGRGGSHADSIYRAAPAPACSDGLKGTLVRFASPLGDTMSRSESLEPSDVTVEIPCCCCTRVTESSARWSKSVTAQHFLRAGDPDSRQCRLASLPSTPRFDLPQAVARPRIAECSKP